MHYILEREIERESALVSEEILNLNRESEQTIQLVLANVAPVTLAKRTWRVAYNFLGH